MNRRGLIKGLASLFAAAPVAPVLARSVPAETLPAPDIFVSKHPWWNVTGVNVVSGGSGYTTPPSIVIDDLIAVTRKTWETRWAKAAFDECVKLPMCWRESNAGDPDVSV